MSKFTVSWWVVFFDHEPEIHYLIDEEFEAESLDEMYAFLEEGMDNNTFEPEEKIPDSWSLGNLNLEYGIIRDKKGNVLYKDEDLDEDKIPFENRL